MQSHFTSSKSQVSIMSPNTQSNTRNEVRLLLVSSAVNGMSIFQNLYNCLYEGFDDFLTEYGKDPNLRSISKSLVILDKIACRLRQLAATCPDDYEFRDEQNAYNLVVRGQLNCRIRKVDEFGRPRPGHTKRFEQFCNQSLTLDLGSGYTTSMNLFLGHDINDFYTTLRNVHVSCPDPDDIKRVLWRLTAHDMHNVQAPGVFSVDSDDILPVITLKSHLLNGTKNQGE